MQPAICAFSIPEIRVEKLMPARIATTMAPIEWALLGTLSVLWGGTYLFAEVALQEIGPLILVLARVALAAVALVLVVYASGHRLPASFALWGAFFVMGILNNLIPFSLIFWGQTRISGGLAAILNATTPLFTVVIAHCLTRDEKMSANRLAGVLLGIAGVAITIGFDALRELGLHLLAQVAVLGAALSYALAGIFGRRFQDVPPIVSAAGQVTATTALIVPTLLVLDQPLAPIALTLETWGAILGLALLSTALAYLIYFRLLASAGATNLLLVTFLIPVSATVLGASLLGEHLAMQHLAGMAMIGLGLATIDGRLLRILRRGPAPAPLSPTSSSKPT
jgi:drug/metabolite transporter (DMT)-like permease